MIKLNLIFMNDFNDYIKKRINEGYLCNICADIANNAKSKKEFMDMVLCSGGISWLQEMQIKDRGLSYDIMRNHFKDYINGKYIAYFPNCNNSKIYTGALYMDITDKLDITTNYVTLFNCQCEINIPENIIVTMCIDKNCDVMINCPENSRCKIECYGNAISSSNNVKIIWYGVKDKRINNSL